MKVPIATEGGTLALEAVPFDTELFGFDVARITDCQAKNAAAFEELYAAAVARGREAGFEHVSRRVLGDAFAEISGLERAGYQLLDLGIVFDHDLRGVKPGLPDGIKVATESDIDRVVAECATIFRTSRYYHDPSFDAERADELHRRWIWNSFRGRADAVLVPAEATAFVTCAVDKSGLGNIALFGVAPGAQGRGVGQRLLGAALAWFAERAKRVEVKTQSINYAASRMYERGGFRLCRSELTYGRAIGEKA
jgi:dTDP-4-amino-4,6-dideoxy-D-galactose acyltransferase